MFIPWLKLGIWKSQKKPDRGYRTYKVSGFSHYGFVTNQEKWKTVNQLKIISKIKLNKKELIISQTHTQLQHIYLLSLINVITGIPNMHSWARQQVTLNQKHRKSLASQSLSCDYLDLHKIPSYPGKMPIQISYHMKKPARKKKRFYKPQV